MEFKSKNGLWASVRYVRVFALYYWIARSRKDAKRKRLGVLGGLKRQNGLWAPGKDDVLNNL